MIISKIPTSVLHAATDIPRRYAEMIRYHAEKDREQNYEEQSKQLAIQESNRLLRNYNYAKDTEELRQYVFSQNVYEQRLLNSYTVKGIFVDRYI